MAKTLATLRADFFNLIDEDEGDHISQSLANGFINEAIQKIAVETHHPRKFGTATQVTQDDADYDCPSDFNYLVGAYFGDEDIEGDKLPLKIVREGNIKYINPNWLDRSDASQGRPERLVFIDRNTFMLDPRPSAAESATGKKYHLYYSYLPATLSSDTESPDLPDAYHDTIKKYAAYLAYLGKLANPDMAANMNKLFYSEINGRSDSAEEESEELMRFSWGFQEP